MSSELVGGEGVAARPQLPPAKRPAQKHPVVALVLSFLFPGIGQAYNAQPAKALVFFSAFAASLYATVEGPPFPWALLIPFVYFYNLVDAYRSAEIVSAQGEIEDPVESPVWGAFLIGLGVLLLLTNLGFLSLSSLHRFWPLVLIGFGGFFVYTALERREKASRGPQD